MNNQINTRFGNAIAFCKRKLRDSFIRIFSPDNFRLIVGKQCARMFSASIAPSLISHISEVLRLGAKPQVVRINARRIVASRAVVQNSYSFWDDTEMNNPRSSSSNYAATSIAVPSNETVTLPVSTPCPDPTGISLVDALPKAVAKGAVKALWKCGVLLKIFSHSKSLVFVVPAPVQLQLAGALLKFNSTFAGVKP